MKIEDLFARLEANAAVQAKPISVEVEGLGTLYVRARTVLEFEQMASIRSAQAIVKASRTDEAGADEDVSKKDQGTFAPALARLLCDEDGNRFLEEHIPALTELLAKQPEKVFHALLEASDGKTNTTTIETKEGETLPN